MALFTGEVASSADIIDRDRAAAKAQRPVKSQVPLNHSLVLTRGEFATVYKRMNSKAIAEEGVGAEIYARYATQLSRIPAPLHLKMSLTMELPIQHRGGHIIEHWKGKMNARYC